MLVTAFFNQAFHPLPSLTESFLKKRANGIRPYIGYVLGFRFKNYSLPLFIYIIFALGSLSLAQFASLTITPNGEPQLDISTGITTLPQGGLIVDKARDITLNATFIEYQDNSYIKAQSAQAEGFFGLLFSPEFYLDRTQNIITASGGITLSKDGLSLNASSLTLYLTNGIAVLSGNVNNQEPKFQAATLVLKMGAGYSLLVSPFNYQDLISKDEAGSLIQLNQTREADDSFTYNISATPDEAVQAELEPYIP